MSARFMDKTRGVIREHKIKTLDLTRFEDNATAKSDTSPPIPEVSPTNYENAILMYWRRMREGEKENENVLQRAFQG